MVKPLLSLGLVLSVVLGCASTGCKEGGSTEKQLDSSAVPPAQVRSVAKPIKLTVAALTDFHGALEPETYRTAAGETVSLGGAPVIASYIEILRKKAPGPVVLVDAGDLFQGTMVSNMAEGAPVIRFYNKIGVNASALGNHDFDYGPVGEKSVPLDPSDDPVGALKERLHEAQFPMLGANVTTADGVRPEWLKSSVIVEAGDARVGVVGVADTETPSTTNRLNLKGLNFGSMSKAIIAEAKKLREQDGVDAVVVAMHQGGSCNKLGDIKRDQDNLAGCDGAVFEVVKQFPDKLVDVVIAGHTHKEIAKRIGSTVILEPASSGKRLAWAEVTIAPRGEASVERPTAGGFVFTCGNVVQLKSKSFTCDKGAVMNAKGPVSAATFLGEEVVPDAEVAKLLEPDFERVRELEQKPLGVKALSKFSKSYGGESSLGNLFADAIRWSVSGADVGVTNGGGLREDIPVGPITYGTIFDVMPFDNRVAVVTADGKTLRKMVELGISGDHGALSWSGLSFVINGCDLGTIEVGGRSLVDDQTYKIATNDYLASGGSGFDRLGLREDQVQVLWSSGMILRDVVVRAITSWGKDLSTDDFYDRKSPRQKRVGSCNRQ